MTRNKKKGKPKPKVNKELEGFEIEINNLGEINSSIEIDKINNFLNKELEDKKLRDREDYSKIKKEKDGKKESKKKRSK